MATTYSIKLSKAVTALFGVLFLLTACQKKDRALVVGQIR